MQETNGFQIPTGVANNANNVNSGSQIPDVFDPSVMNNTQSTPSSDPFPFGAMPSNQTIPSGNGMPSIPSEMMINDTSNLNSFPTASNNVTFSNVDNALNTGLSSSINFDSMHVYRCGDCKSRFSSCNNTPINHCVICNSLNIQSGELTYDSVGGIVNFSVPITDAIADYKSKVMTNPLVPGIFKKKDVINSMAKLYIPGYLFDVSVSGDIDFLAADKNDTVINGQKAVETRKYGSSYTVNMDYEGVFMNCSNVINDTTINGINNFNFSSLSQFNQSSLGDSYLLFSDLQKDEAETKMKNSIIKHTINIIRKNIVHELKKMQSNSLMTGFRSSRNIFVPVYLLSIPFEGKNYYYIMNGSNGKSTINIPLSKKIMFIFGFIVFAIVFGITFLIVSLL